ncbi:Hypothetical protein (Fragment) [Durusdinium trenchii]|uniref:Uncharacterized protein n=1 Tax=Durusdinium trenchii TaxID=1381693 RepID=A0ABP0RIU0_9DINO
MAVVPHTSDMSSSPKPLRRLVRPAITGQGCRLRLGAAEQTGGSGAELTCRWRPTMGWNREIQGVNYATMFGLATVLTEQGDSGKLLQAEALFHDFLEKAISQEEKGITETYRGFTGLADNLERQKRWMEASHAWQQAVDLATPMCGAPESRQTGIPLVAVLVITRSLSAW